MQGNLPCDISIIGYSQVDSIISIVSIYAVSYKLSLLRNVNMPIKYNKCLFNIIKITLNRQKIEYPILETLAISLVYLILENVSLDVSTQTKG